MTTDKPIAIVEKPCDVEETSQPFGKRWGQDTVTLTSEHIQALKDGKHLAVDVKGEYVVFLRMKHDGESRHQQAKG